MEVDVDGGEARHRSHGNRDYHGPAPTALRGRERQAGRKRLGGWLCHCADETISPSGEGFDESRFDRRVSQDSSKAGNGISNAMFEIDKGIGRPEFRPQLL